MKLKLAVRNALDLKEQLLKHKDLNFSFANVIVRLTENLDPDMSPTYDKMTYGHEGQNPDPSNLGIVHLASVDGSYFEIKYLYNTASKNNLSGIQDILDVEHIL